MSCQNPFEPPKPEKPAAGTGYFSLAINQNPGRTILPATVQSDFTQYTLEFFTAGTSANPVTTVTRYNNDLAEPVELAAGTWDLRVSAYVAYLHYGIAAQGSLSNIVIGAGETVARSVTLGPIVNSGQGTFSWNISFETPNNVTSANMTITPLDTATGTAEQSVNLKSSPNSSATLNSGYYRVVFKLFNNEGLNIERRETLHIYQNMESAFECTFKDNQFVNEIIVTSNADSGPGSLRQAIADVPDGSTIVITIQEGVGTIALTGTLNISKSVTIEGNGVTITRDPSWTTVDSNSRLMFVGYNSDVIVNISRIHFKDGRLTDYDSKGAAICNSGGNLSLESCIFSGNQTNYYGGAVYSSGGTLNIKGCTFYGNSASGGGGAVYTNGGTLSFEGNLFYGNTADSGLVYQYNGTGTSKGYNVVDVPFGTGSNQSGWAAVTGDKTISDFPFSIKTFRLFPGSGAANVITTRPADYPTVDFYGNPIPANGAAAGAVQATLSGSGYNLDVSVNDASRGTVSASPAPNADGLFTGTVTLTANANAGYDFSYWLVDGEQAGSTNPLSLTMSKHAKVQAVFGRPVLVTNFNDDMYSETTAGTLRNALSNAQDFDIIRFSGVTPGTSTVELYDSLPSSL